MINEDLLQNEISEMERELEDLKTVQGVLRTARAYSYTGTFGASGARITLEITYADGDSPIVLSWFGSGFIVPLKIVGNKQKIHIGIYGGQELSFYSTREIKNVVRL